MLAKVSGRHGARRWGLACSRLDRADEAARSRGRKTGRSAYIERYPERDPVRILLSRWTATNGPQDDRADLLARLNAQIQDHDANVIPSFLMRTLAGAGLPDVWRHEILPPLPEHHFGEGVDLEARYDLATLPCRSAPDASDRADGASVDD